jgi:CRP-like cAMP-binding protein
MTAKRKPGVAPTAFLKQVGPGRTIHAYRNKEVIYAQGSPAEAVFYVQAGMVKLTVASNRRPKKALLAILQAGDLFGEGCVGREPRRISTATSIGPSTLTRLRKAAFRQKIDRDPAFAAMFIAYLLRQTARFKADLADHFLNFSERRLARILVMYKGFIRKSKGDAFSLRLSQATLAEMVGTTRARVSTFLNRFKQKGYIRYKAGLQINSERLTAFLQGSA